MRIVQAGCDALQALERGSRQGLGFFNPHGLFADSAHTDAQESDAQESIVLQDVERARNRPAHPVGFFSQSGDGPRPRALLFFLFLCSATDFFSAPPDFFSFAVSLPGWNCFRQNPRGDMAEGAATARLTDIYGTLFSLRALFIFERLQFISAHSLWDELPINVKTGVRGTSAR